MKKKIDHLGRVVIPKPIREALSLTEGSNMILHFDLANKEITLKKDETICAACGNPNDLQKVGQIFLCQSCIHQIKG